MVSRSPSPFPLSLRGASVPLGDRGLSAARGHKRSGESYAIFEKNSADDGGWFCDRPVHGCDGATPAPKGNQKSSEAATIGEGEAVMIGPKAQRLHKSHVKVSAAPARSGLEEGRP